VLTDHWGKKISQSFHQLVIIFNAVLRGTVLLLFWVLEKRAFCVTHGKSLPPPFPLAFRWRNSFIFYAIKVFPRCKIYQSKGQCLIFINNFFLIVTFITIIFKENYLITVENIKEHRNQMDWTLSQKRHKFKDFFRVLTSSIGPWMTLALGQIWLWQNTTDIIPIFLSIKKLWIISLITR